jgi:hypothetical protein
MKRNEMQHIIAAVALEHMRIKIKCVSFLLLYSSDHFRYILPCRRCKSSFAEARKCLAAALIIVQQQLYDIQFFSAFASSVVNLLEFLQQQQLIQ